MRDQTFLSVGAIVAVVLVAALFFLRGNMDRVISLFVDPETHTAVIQNGEVVTTVEDNKAAEEVIKGILQQTDTLEPVTTSTKEIMITAGIKHTVPLNEIKGGGPPKDGIPPIDNPEFVSISAAEGWLADETAGISYTKGNTARFYPFNILVWHEIVNDTVEGNRVLISYCPLCLSGIVFDPLVQGERVEFGTSGKLWNSNLVMYDRKTDTYWSQVLGEAIRGELAGSQLNVLPSDQVRFGEWKKEYPDGEVLSQDTGIYSEDRYTIDPYGSYYTTPGTFFEVNATDSRLEDKDFVLGVVVNGKAKAYYPPAIASSGTVRDTFEGKTLILEHDKELDAVRIFEEMEDGTKERVNPFGNFWFSWVAAHPDTELFK